MKPGEALARARHQRQLGLDEVACQLKLPKSIVQDLEADRLERIAPIYRRGYITNYARLLGLDDAPLLAELEHEEPVGLRAVMPRQASGIKFDRFIKFATYLLVTTMIVPPLVYFFVFGGARFFEAEVSSRSNADLPSASEPATQATTQQRIAGALALEDTARADQRGSHLAASAVPFSVIRPLESTKDAPATPSVSEAPVDAEPDLLSTLRVELTDDSWVEIESADGQRLEFDLLRSGVVREYRGRPPFRLLLGRGNAARLSIDNQPVALGREDSAGVVELSVGELALSTPNPSTARPSTAE
ncbi:MAG: helix-turn-helix domain-containing protein [Wenzhouxiangellaceae bacterium]